MLSVGNLMSATRVETIEQLAPSQAHGDCFLGIDAGSTN